MSKKRLLGAVALLLLAGCTLPGVPAATPHPTAAAPSPTTPVLPPPTSRPAAPALAAYVGPGGIWTYDGETRQLQVADERAYGPLLSPDGRRLLYRRQEKPRMEAADPFGLWLHEVGTGQEREVDLSALPTQRLTFEGREMDLPRWPVNLAWLPGSEGVLFGTMVDYSTVGPGLSPADDLWRLDAATGEVRNLLPESEPPASFTLSPDGEAILVNRPGRIEWQRLDGAERRVLLEFPPVLTYSEYAWLPQPHWLPDSRAALVAIAPADPMQSSVYTLWRLDVAAGRASQVGQVEGSIFAWSPDGRSWSPDGTRLAYVTSHEGQSRVWLLSLDPGDAGTAASVSLGEPLPRILGWFPDGQAVLVQDEADLYAVTAGPGAQSRSLFAVGAEPAQLHRAGSTLLISSGDGRLFELTPDGTRGHEVP